MRKAIGDTPASSEPLVLSLSALGPNTAKPAPIVGRGLMTRGHGRQGLSALGTSGAPKDMAVAHRRMGRMGDGQ